MTNAPLTNQSSRRSLQHGRDAYGELLRDTRGLRREQQHLRDTWFATLPAERKDDLLFELEILLKGIACFANPRNHPGPPRRAPVVMQDYREPLLLVRGALTRVVQLSRVLLGERDRAFVFHRYLETVLPEDSARTQLLQAGMTQNTPDEALFVLRHGMTNVIEVADGLLRLPRVPYRLFYALCVTIQREIGQNAFFNPLTALEFRPEFDRIKSRQVLQLIDDVPGEQAHRLVALTFLSLFRMLRYLRLCDAIAREHGEASRHAGRIYLVLAVLRSDARALAAYLRRKAGSLLADSYEDALLGVQAGQLHSQHDRLLQEGYRLIAIRSALEGIAATLRLEMRRTFEHDLPSPDAGESLDDLKVRIAATSGNLRPALQNAILFLAKGLGVRLEEGGVFDENDAKRLSSERLRRDVWIFAQILRAFTLKAHHAKTSDDRWSGAASFRFVKEFLAYFRAMGYPLLRGSDYPRFDAFMGAMAAIEDTDLLDPVRLANAKQEATAFQEFLQDLFNAISNREELEGTPFNRKAAAQALRLYLGSLSQAHCHGDSQTATEWQAKIGLFLQTNLAVGKLRANTRAMKRPSSVTPFFLPAALVALLAGNAVVASGCSDDAASAAPPALSTAPCDEPAFEGSPVGIRCGKLVDTQGRVVNFQGINARVQGLFDVTFDDGRIPLEPIPEFGAEDALAMGEFGFDSLRLPINWSGIEPTENGGFNEAYLDQMEKVIRMAEAAGLNVLIDFHQDAYSKEIGEDGAPLWAIQPPPEKLLQGPLEDLEQRRLSGQVSKAFDTFFGDSEQGKYLRERFVKMAVHVATRFANDPAVMGFEIYNEPVAKMAKLRQLYEPAYKQLLEVAPKKLFFFEPNAFRNFTDTAPYATSPIGPGSVYAPHIYTLVFSGTDDSRANVDKDFLRSSHEESLLEAQSWKAPLVITEWGFDPYGQRSPDYFRFQAELQDETQSSSYLWVWKENSQGSWGMYDWDEAKQAWVPRQITKELLARVRPRAVAGWPSRYAFDKEAGAFELEFTADPTISAPHIIGISPVFGQPLEVSCYGKALGNGSATPQGDLEVNCGQGDSQKHLLRVSVKPLMVSQPQK